MIETVFISALYMDVKREYKVNSNLTKISQERSVTIMSSVKHANFWRVTLYSLVVFGSVESCVCHCPEKLFLEC